MTTVSPNAYSGLRDRIEARFDADPAAVDEVRALVLAALDGSDSLDALLARGELREPTARAASSQPLGAYITSLAVEGFRGIGPRTTLELAPGPGLTMVIGRNGSGKSSFAEALEVLFTGDNQRWARRSAVWKEGWRNLHHSHAAIEATLAVEGQPGTTTVRREWRDGASLDDSRVDVQPHGEKKTDLSFLNWEDALVTHRPFLSYSELGSMLDEGPTKLHDAVSVVLGLEDLAVGEKALRDARLAREKAQKAMLSARDEIRELLETVNDDRARRAASALQGQHLILDVVEQLVTEPANGDGASEIGVLNRVCATQFPS